MSLAIIIIQIVSALILTGMILVQSKGSGLGKAWGGGKGTSFTRRGLERVIFRSTFLVAFIFVFASILALVV